ncbi:uncharacterized protein LOC132944173 [Metopolophium dirhodum]|uniref:uncharacterized protein LOC132944173 n=1 Tax=Metopolophium dirhodum TaxID=44670 RepID=UPI00299044BB|nr:uncharacterized protein LOC132944173 [Metopolophium dirhodum]
MKTLFLLCTAVTILQVLDVSITGVTAAGTPNPLKTPDGANNPNAGKLRMTIRGLKKPDPTPNNTKPADVPVDNDPGTNPNDDDSAEAEPPKTFRESGKRVVNTLKKMATNRGVGFLNGFTGFLKRTGGAFNFFGNFLRDRAKNVKDVAKENLEMVSSFSDSTTRGAKHLLNSGRVIGTQVGKEMYSSLQKSTRLGINVTKLGGAAAGTPLSIAGDVVDTTKRIVKIPSRVSKIVTGVINPALNFVGPDSGEEQPEEEEEEEEEKKEDPPKAPVKTPPTPSKLTVKKPSRSS